MMMMMMGRRRGPVLEYCNSSKETKKEFTKTKLINPSLLGWGVAFSSSAPLHHPEQLDPIPAESGRAGSDCDQPTNQ
jgi:hypothetical protein